MKAIVYELTAPRTLVASEQTLDCGDLEPLALVAATEFSVVSTGTELAAWTGKPPLRPCAAYPRVVGYCNVARVIEVGAAVAGIARGDYVLTHQSHRSLFRCQCSDILLAVRGLDIEARRRLATLYLYHLGYRALLDGHYVPGHEVAVVGLGVLGFTTASLVLRFGGEPIVLTRQLPGEMPSCLARAHILPKALPAEGHWPSRTGLEGADLVVNTSDRWPDYWLSLNVTRRGGTIVLLGFPGRGAAFADFNPLDPQLLYDKRLTIRQCGSVSNTDVPADEIRFTLKRNLQYLWALICAGSLDPSPLITRQLSWHDLSAAYESLALRRDNTYSTLIDWTC